MLADCERNFNVINKELPLTELTFGSEWVCVYDTIDDEILDELRMGLK